MVKAEKTPGASLANLIDFEERNDFVMQELPQVYYIATRILERLPSQIELDDLVHAGVLGLLDAYRSFDSTKNTQFKTFAKFRIRGAILDSLRALDWGSRGLRRRAREIAETTSELEGALGRQPSKDEIASAMKLSLSELDTSMTQIDGLNLVGQQSAPFADGDEGYDLIESSPSTWENPFVLCCKAEERGKLSDAIALLSEREQLILALYYREELTMKEAAEVIGIAVSRVSQIHSATLAKLKKSLGNLGGRSLSPGAKALSL